LLLTCTAVGLGVRCVPSPRLAPQHEGDPLPMSSRFLLTYMFSSSRKSATPRRGSPQRVGVVLELAHRIHGPKIDLSPQALGNRWLVVESLYPFVHPATQHRVDPRSTGRRRVMNRVVRAARSALAQTKSRPYFYPHSCLTVCRIAQWSIPSATQQTGVPSADAYASATAFVVAGVVSVLRSSI